MNIDWLHELLRDWGDYVRQQPKSLPAESTEYKLFRGNIQLPPGPTHPRWRENADVIEVHVAWRKMPLQHKVALWAAYVERGSPEQRAEFAGYKNTAELYRQRNMARYYLLGAIDTKKDLQITPPVSAA